MDGPNDNGVITKNNENQKKGVGIQYQTGLAGLQHQSGLGIAFGAVAAGTQAGYGAFTAGGGSLANIGKKS